MLKLPHHMYFPLPLILSFMEWSTFSLYWSAAAKNSSRALSSEPSKSRRLHECLVNVALLLVVLPVHALNPRLLPGGWFSWIGLSIQTVSIVFAVWARLHLGANWSGAITIKVDHQLIRSGPYRCIRHPIYAAILGMFVGGTVVSGKLLALIGLITAASAYWRKILLEEANLKHAFGSAYDVYQGRTGSLIPTRWTWKRDLYDSRTRHDAQGSSK